MAATTPSPNQSTRISMFDIHAFLRDLNKNPPTGANVDVNDLDSVWMPLISAKINASTVDFKALRRGLQDQCEDGGPEDLAVAEMIAVWMSEVPQSRGRAEGLALLAWLDQHGLMSARYNLAVKQLQMRSKPAMVASGLRLLRSVVDAPGINDRLRGMAHYSLGSCNREAIGVPWSESKALSHFRKAADLGHADAAFQMGLAYDEKLNGKRFLPVDSNRAAHYYEIGSTAGSVKARTNLGVLHMALAFEGADRDRGRQLLRDAFSEGDATAGDALRLFEAAIEEEQRRTNSSGAKPPASRQPDGDMARILHHCYVRGQPTVADLDAMAPDDVTAYVIDHHIVNGLLNLIIRVRADGYLRTEQEFAQILHRLETPEDRRALAEDVALWRRFGLPV